MESDQSCLCIWWPIRMDCYTEKTRWKCWFLQRMDWLCWWVWKSEVRTLSCLAATAQPPADINGNSSIIRQKYHSRAAAPTKHFKESYCTCTPTPTYNGHVHADWKNTSEWACRKVCVEVASLHVFCGGRWAAWRSPAPAAVSPSPADSVERLQTAMVARLLPAAQTTKHVYMSCICAYTCAQWTSVY